MAGGGRMFPLEEGFGEPWFPKSLELIFKERFRFERIESRLFNFQTPIRACICVQHKLTDTSDEAERWARLNL